jgi:hypothetical protein
MGKVGLSEVVGSDGTGAEPPETGADAEATADPVRGGMFGHGWAGSVAGVGIGGVGGGVGGVCWWYGGGTGGGTTALSIGLYIADWPCGGGLTSGAGGSGNACGVSLGTGLASCTGAFSSSGGQNGSTSRSGGVPLVPGT